MPASRRIIAIRLAAVLAFALPAAAQAQEYGVGLGSSHFSGRYGGTERSTIHSVYLSANAATGPWRLDLTLPYIRVEGAGAVDVGGIIIPIEGLGRSRGLGDLTLRLTRSVPGALGTPLDLSLAAQVKLPTGAASVSTGKADGAAEIAVSSDVGAFSPSVTISYRVLGDLDFFRLKDGWSLSAGSGLIVGKVYLSASYDWSQAAAGGPDPEEVFLLAAGPLGRGWSWNLFGSKGFSAGAADYGVGGGIARSFGRRAAQSPRPRRPLPTH